MGKGTYRTKELLMFDATEDMAQCSIRGSGWGCERWRGFRNLKISNNLRGRSGSHGINNG